MKLLIAEEALIGRDGHWFEYMNTITKELRKSGETVKVAGNIDATEDILVKLEADPVFPESAWGKRFRSNNWNRLMQIWQHNNNLYSAASDYLEKEGTFDVLFVPTILIDHIFGWRKFVKKYAGKKVKKVVLFFVNGQGTYQGPGKPIIFNTTPNKLLFKQALSTLKREIQEGIVFLGCETREMAREYEEFCGLPFEYLPHPVDVAPFKKELTTKPGLTIAHLGFSRYEKGSDLLQEAIKKYMECYPEADVKFVLQWLNDFQLENGNPCCKDPDLLANPKVEYIDQPLDSKEYAKLIAQTDIMILPYRLRAYYARVSRVAIEAAINSIPMIYTKNSWNESLVEDGHGAGVGFDSESVESLFEAIEETVKSFPDLHRKAEENQPSAFKHYSAETFEEFLKFMTGYAQGEKSLSQP